jgi:hypothetical protein
MEKVQKFLFVTTAVSMTMLGSQSLAAAQVSIAVSNSTQIEASKTRKLDWEFKLPRILPSNLEKLLKVSFVSSRDLRLLARENDANIFVSASLCKRKSNRYEKYGEELTFSRVIDDLGYIPIGGGTPVSKQTKPSYSYHVYLVDPNFESMAKIKSRHIFNGSKKLICMELGGGGMLPGSSIRSNLVAIELLR